MQRYLESEWLDALRPEDPRAVASRRDLRLLNACMGNAATAARAVRRSFPQAPPRSLADLGAGDGTLLLQMAARLPQTWRGLRVVLVDRHNALSARTRKALEQRGWEVELVEADVFDWLKDPAIPASDALVTNLFLHHFAESALRELLAHSAARTRVFVAVEPRRSVWARAFSRCVWVLGCNAVTRHDAPVSVGAGFTGSELSRCWPGSARWSLHEVRAGLFSHLFVARKLPL